MAAGDHELLVDINRKLDDALKLSERLAVVETKQEDCPARQAFEQGHTTGRRMVWLTAGLLVVAAIGVLFQVHEYRKMWREIRTARAAPAKAGP